MLKCKGYFLNRKSEEETKKTTNHFKRGGRKDNFNNFQVDRKETKTYG